MKKTRFMRSTIVAISLGLYLLSGCSKECPDGICTPKLLWTQSLSDGKLTSTFQPIVYKNKVIYSRNVPTGEVTEKTRLRFLDKENGNLFSEWNDLIVDFDNLSYNAKMHIYENKLTFGNAARIYEIDMNTEKTIYKNYEKERCGLIDVTGLGEVVYHYEADCTNNTYEEYIVEYNLVKQTKRVVYTTKPEGQYFNYLKNPIPYINEEKDTILIFNIAHFFNGTPSNTQGLLVAYNLTKQKEIYKEELSVDNFAGFPALPLLHNGKVYMPFGNSIYCHDQYTGKQLWRKFFPHDFLSSDPIIAEGKLYAACENKRLFCLNLDKGNIIWETDGTGTPSNLAYMNGVIYFIGGSDGKLHAVDANTGTHIWRFASPDLEKNDDAFFQKAITVDPSTNRVYTATYLNAMCFEAAR